MSVPLHPDLRARLDAHPGWYHTIDLPTQAPRPDSLTRPIRGAGSGDRRAAERRRVDGAP